MALKDGLDNHFWCDSLLQYSTSSTKHLDSKILPRLPSIRSLLPKTISYTHIWTEVGGVSSGWTRCTLVRWEYHHEHLSHCLRLGPCHSLPSVTISLLTFKAMGHENHDHHRTFSTADFQALRQKSAANDIVCHWRDTRNVWKCMCLLLLPIPPNEVWPLVAHVDI